VPPPKPGSSIGLVTSTGTTLTIDGLPTGATPYEEDTKVKCFQ
jgi:hypothetical protein